jgi:hypothetical protein
VRRCAMRRRGRVEAGTTRRTSVARRVCAPSSIRGDGGLNEKKRRGLRIVNATCLDLPTFLPPHGPARSTQGVSSRLGNFGTFRARRITRPGARHARGSRPLSPRTAAMAEEETTPAPPRPPSRLCSCTRGSPRTPCPS